MESTEKRHTLVNGHAVENKTTSKERKWYVSMGMYLSSSVNNMSS